MNTNQPKPATGEWTVNSVRDLLDALGGRSDKLPYRVIADAHNAALAAERESYIELCDKANGDMIALNQQLAAERKKVKLLEEELDQAVKLLKLEDIDAAIARVEARLKK